VPSILIILDSLPLTLNGKIDRKSLLMLSEIKRDSDATAIAPRNDLEMALTKIWEQILGIKNIGIRDNFFELGGNSLLAVRLFAKIEKTFQKNLPLTNIYQSPTVEELANILCSQPGSSNWYSLVPIQLGGSRPPLFGIHYIYFKELSGYLGEEQPVYALHYGMGEVTNRAISLPKMEDLASHYIQEMRSLQPEGPYFLMGLSAGGLIAYEMAQQLVAQGQQVDLLAMFDTYIESNMKLLPLHQRLFNLLEMSPSQCLEKVKDNITRKFRRLKYGTQYLPHMYIPEVDISIVKAYTPKTYSGRVLLFKANDHFSVNYGRVSPELGWRKFINGDLEIHEVPGGHLSILEEPYVQVVAEKLRDYLNRHSSQSSHVASLRAALSPQNQD
jgi:thioesterase domain-containing protein/acyl carrier protein